MVKGNLCARASPDEDKATGFFVACFERVAAAPTPKGSNDSYKSPYPSSVPSFITPSTPTEETTETTESAETTETTKPSKPSKPTKSNKSNKSKKSTKTTKATKPTKQPSKPPAKQQSSKKRRKINPTPIVSK